ncbi:U-box domain-containing protein 38-like [Hordeum vulgare subsp. vulgare]|uniref:U-box domain-containing protein 38-like n=1 Tax=Hordeum vulgare subsp. vulgare TaxID=112509 RepID=UPI001D1A4B94|nr:U-box domain-containing protein 38-like [Hordeum vulgare subsp. vulgare]
MAIYQLSLAAVNQSQVARFPGASKALLSVASSAAEPTPIRRLALMVICNVGGCSEGRASLMDAGAVAAVSGILLFSHDVVELEEWCVAAIYALSRGSLWFCGLARAAGADKALRRVAEEGTPGGVRREMARKTLRAMRGDLDEDADLTGSNLECDDGDDCGRSIVLDGFMSRFNYLKDRSTHVICGVCAENRVRPLERNRSR